ncbi:phospholipase A1 member A-like [Eupeodes corollae]|uniref:phospholipase A1 member A-like n=1 Tax=Eupeodes corollae TaxID=290404 RepID=UPI002491A11C|nr:phospholipase A1 member A-like [Eupeodes corollae]
MFAVVFTFKTSKDVDVNSVKIVFYYGPCYKDFEVFDLNDGASLLKHSKFIHNHTTLFMPGYKNRRMNSLVFLLAKSYLEGNFSNFVYLDWEELANGNYTSAQQNVFKLSEKVADFIIDLFKLGMDEDSFSMIGQSMGARGIGVIARDVIVRSNGSRIVSRITPLDPSNEEAHDNFILPVIEKSFAKFVDVIHSDSGGVGTRKAMGHANFWPNNGIALQPGCPDVNQSQYCSHRKATAYWAESVANRNPILAFPSGSYEKLLKNGIEKYMDRAVPMGIDCPKGTRGDYYLQHNTTFGHCFFIVPTIGETNCQI